MAKADAVTRIKAGPKTLVPNATTVAALKELEQGKGEVFRGSTREILKQFGRLEKSK